MLTATLFDTVRASCRAVSEQARWVRVDVERIPPYAASLPAEGIEAPSLDPAHHYLGPPEKTLAFVLTLDAINFGSGYFPYLQKRPGLSGYHTIATCLKEWFERLPTVSPETLLRLTPEQCAGVFGQTAQPLPEPVRELMSLYAEALNALGRLVQDDYGGRFAGLVEAANHSAETLVGLLDRMPFYRDVHRYRAWTVPFYKRAQITAADLSIALAGHDWGRFDDLDRLTMFADNLVPHVLRLDGLLQFEAGLAERIDREKPVPAGSPEEIEIRACALTAVEMLVAELHKRGYAVTARDVDYFLWNRGQQPRYKSQPRHRTRCVYY